MDKTNKLTVATAEAKAKPAAATMTKVKPKVAIEPNPSKKMKAAEAEQRRRLFVDCGANAELIALLAEARKLRARVLAFEETYNQETLRRTYHKAGVMDGDLDDAFSSVMFTNTALNIEDPTGLSSLAAVLDRFRVNFKDLVTHEG